MDGPQFEEMLAGLHNARKRTDDNDDERQHPSITRRELRGLNNLPPAQFEAWLDELKAKGF